MASKSIQDGGIEIENINKQKTRGRPSKTSSNTNSRNRSRNISPTNTANTGKEESDDIWKCRLCTKLFADQDDKLLECQRCGGHFCIKCLNKTVEEYNLMNNSDIMWFCAPCREKVERNIVVDREIEDRCKDMMKMFEDRVKFLEDEMTKKCDEDKVRDIVSLMTKASEDAHEENHRVSGKEATGHSVTAVMSEINERKIRECNMIIYGTKESDSEDRERRWNFDRDIVKGVANVCGVSLVEENITKTIRLGAFSTENQSRPLLVAFSQPGKKVEFFKGGSKLRESELKDVRLANDLTRTERDTEKNLYMKVKDLNEKSSGEFRFRIRGPPWARKIVKARTNDQE